MKSQHVFLFYFVTDDDLEEFVESIVKISGKGVSVLRNSTGDLNWSFGQALIFSATVITTIGKCSKIAEKQRRFA